MKIGLIDVDGHSKFPNLALMKLSAWHKANGDHVEWVVPIECKHYDKVYMSKVFTFEPDYQYFIDADEVIKGGTGYKDYSKVLPDEIESIFPDYSIYPDCDYAIGFLTRGCIRNCPWCIVPMKEGKIRPAATWKQIKRPDSNKIIFMDNNVLASEHGIQQIEEMSRENIRIDFNQGIDARLIDDRIAELLSKCKWIRHIRISCDTESMLPVVKEKVALMAKYGIKPYKIFCYVLVRDVGEAMRIIDELDRIGIEPFAQPYRDFDGGEPTKEQKRLARWCNMRATHKSCSYEEFNG